MIINLALRSTSQEEVEIQPRCFPLLYHPQKKKFPPVIWNGNAVYLEACIEIFRQRYRNSDAGMHIVKECRNSIIRMRFITPKQGKQAATRTENTHVVNSDAGMHIVVTSFMHSTSCQTIILPVSKSK